MASTTRHLGVRMSQRGITAEMIDFVQTYGLIVRDKVILRRKELVQLLPDLDEGERATALKLLDKGGIVVVEDEGALLTTYNFNSFDRRKRGEAPRARRPQAYR